MSDSLDAEMPEAAWVIVNTRMINHYLGTSYTMEEIAAMPELVTDLITGIRGGLEPQVKKRQKAKGF